MKSSTLNSDFHFHSRYSDGSATLKEIFEDASHQKVGALALTDHDTILGIPEECVLSKQYNISVIPAIELTAKEDNLKFHILGYGINPEAEELIAYSKQFLDYQRNKSLKQLQLMRRDGIEIDEDVFVREMEQGPLYRGKFLGLLAKYGYIKPDEVMNLIPSYFGVGAPYYMADDYAYPSFKQAVDLIKRNGGSVVLAHPEKIKKKNEVLYQELIGRCELDGLEVYHPSNGESVRAVLLEECKRRDLIITGGSDYHGLYNKKKTSLLGEAVPVSVYEQLKHLIWKV